MPILTIAYANPTDTEKFDRHYTEVHRPLAEKLPALKELRVRRCTSLDEAPAPNYVLVEPSFESPRRCTRRRVSHPRQ
ncbi:EthD family reductase [Pseudonocardia kujensis]|uniref:EthD family reductase n=1 Tax=Pseudonocardia kujensis TaxID=1128675 RepID=UPI001E4EFDCF|nr:EthD family reductase [Pseudonocardia kujensis]MCE0764607.1 EthD family reductase [Pseudonocardia kujensis]